MNIALWIVAIVLGLAYTVGGIVKLTWPHERYAAKQPWAHDFSARQVNGIGVTETLGGLGLLLPGLLDIAPVLVPIAASAMALYMAGAATERVRRNEPKEFLGDLVFLAALLFVAWGRFGLVPWV
ncbi:DoxX-like protein [Nocardioides albertanoniae]|uniref:DoxX-like protein n=1 Tax=Nocardioides albertanoniae TaxID=1175486 RepID=A0A543A4Q4_9ACTN|nr:DoxX family protein [Nocardioides albertanoniae]TQL67581.1 DoxX-like protein [Nocardioides albertanoniae]